MKNLSFVVHLTLSNSITGNDDELREMADKIAHALKHKAECPTVNEGLVPAGCDNAAVTLITVSHSGLELSELAPQY
jgi:hypothetical protein